MSALEEGKQVSQKNKRFEAGILNTFKESITMQNNFIKQFMQIYNLFEY